MGSMGEMGSMGVMGKMGEMREKSFPRKRESKTLLRRASPTANGWIPAPRSESGTSFAGMTASSLITHISSTSDVELLPESGASSIVGGQLTEACERARFGFVLWARALRDLELIFQDGTTVAK